MQKDKFELLRKKAEKLLSSKEPAPKGEQSEMLELLHELAVNQIELEVQNEELRETQNRLEETKNNYFELYEFAPVGYLNINDHGIISTVNLKAVKMFDLPRSKMLGRALGGFVVPAFQDTFFMHLRGVLADTKSHSCELAIIRPDHAPLFVKMESVCAEHSKAGEGKIIRSAIIDITELNRTRQEIDGLNRNLENKVIERTAVAELRLQQLKALNLELIRAEQRERRRLAEMLHDNLQQLLVGCQMNISFLQKSQDENQKADTLAKTGSTLKDAIELSRTLSYELCPPVLSQGGLSAAFDWLKVQKKTTHNLTVHLNMDSTPPRLPMDIEAFLFQCARELLLNSIKHAKTAEANLSLHFWDGRLILRVSDKGPGCDPSDLEFDRKKKTGFGLFNIKNRIETMQGTFDVDSVNNGFTVTLSLPVTRLQAEAEAEAEAEVKPRIPIMEVPQSQSGKAPIKVMLVDDHQILRQGISHLLEMHDDIAIIAEAEDGLQAIQKARLYQPDVILMDIGLPGMDGVEVTAKITRENQGIRVIALTLHENEGMVNGMLKAGASLYLTKNVPAEAIIEAIRTAAAKPPSQKAGSSR